MYGGRSWKELSYMMPEGNVKTHIWWRLIFQMEALLCFSQTFNDFNGKFNDLSKYVINELKQVQKRDDYLDEFNVNAAVNDAECWYINDDRLFSLLPSYSMKLIKSRADVYWWSPKAIWGSFIRVTFINPNIIKLVISIRYHITQYPPNVSHLIRTNPMKLWLKQLPLTEIPHLIAYIQKIFKLWCAAFEVRVHQRISNITKAL